MSARKMLRLSNADTVERQRLAQGVDASSGTSQRGVYGATFFLLIAILMPSQVNFYLWGESAKMTPGRIAIMLLLFPAISKLRQRYRHFASADFFAFATGAWMIGSRLRDDGLSPSAVAEVMEFLGGYVVARGLYWEINALQTFIRVLKVIVVGVLLVSIMDPLFATNVIWHVQTPQERLGLIRATAMFDGAEMDGAFFAATAPILLYWERTGMMRAYWGGLCSFGCLLSISSGPLLSLIIVISVYNYDSLMKQYSWRWFPLIGIIFAMLMVLFGLAERPMSWIVSHLTFDPLSSYFRMYIFENMFQIIRSSPIIGIGFAPTGEGFLAGVSVDCTWIVYAMRFGIPMIVLFLLTIIMSIAGKGNRLTALPVRVSALRTGFSLAVISFGLTGLTVHIFHTNWVLWAIYLGITANLKEGGMSG
jgi:hypothetical protein